MNEVQCRSDDRPLCCFHPTELVVGVCAFCLNERLLVLASKQANLHRSHTTASPRKSPITIPKILALTSLLNRLDVKPHQPDDDHQHHDVYLQSSSTCSPEDSFISIKFEDNGVASWGRESKKRPHDLQCDMSLRKSWGIAKNAKGVVEHAKPRVLPRWRRRIGHLFHAVRRKRSSKGNVCHVGTKLEATRVKYGWVKTLAKKRSKDH
ncbi:uncharacterized protein LOC127250295 [Andrographis paniculata]|uniref:uncharacterized protein LOC127250295 n=1 Tax=Andrographis paniculata TaxID=175694 RepID=UPI0021E73FEB|nr:uncharacterized protein LOC127250295 [Andrographis paniculata]